MQQKPKPCKGVNKDTKGLGCGKKVLNRYLGLCNECKINFLLHTPKGLERLNKAKITAKKRVKTEQQAKTREWKEANKSIARLIQEARIPFHKWIRDRDINKSCISCGSTTSDIYDAGHFFKAELYTGLIFDERNVHKQCRKCNTYLAGNEAEYRKGLVHRYGDKYVKELEDDSMEKRVYKYSKQEIRDIKEKYLKLNKII